MSFKGGASHGTLRPVRAFPFGCSFFFFFLSFNFLFSICYALLSCLNIYLICPIKSLKKKSLIYIRKATHLHFNGCALGLALKLRHAATRKWAMDLFHLATIMNPDD